MQLLFNHFNIYLLIVLRVPRAYATSAFTDLKEFMEGATIRLRLQEKGDSLQEKGDSLQEKGDSLQEKGYRRKGVGLRDKRCK